MKTLENTLLHFHTGRGGRFRNAGYTTLEGEVSSISDLVVFDYLYLNEDCSDYLDSSENAVGLTIEDVEKGIGTIDFDGDYDTHYVKSMEDLTEKEILLIADSSEFNKTELLELLGMKNIEILDQYNLLIDAVEIDIFDLESHKIKEITEDEEWDNDFPNVEHINDKIYTMAE